MFSRTFAVSRRLVIGDCGWASEPDRSRRQRAGHTGILSEGLAAPSGSAAALKRSKPQGAPRVQSTIRNQGHPAPSSPSPPARARHAQAQKSQAQAGLPPVPGARRVTAPQRATAQESKQSGATAPTHKTCPCPQSNLEHGLCGRDARWRGLPARQAEPWSLQEKKSAPDFQATAALVFIPGFSGYGPHRDYPWEDTPINI